MRAGLRLAMVVWTAGAWLGRGTALARRARRRRRPIRPLPMRSAQGAAEFQPLRDSDPACGPAAAADCDATSAEAPARRTRRPPHDRARSRPQEPPRPLRRASARANDTAQTGAPADSAGRSSRHLPSRFPHCNRPHASRRRRSRHCRRPPSGFTARARRPARAAARFACWPWLLAAACARAGRRIPCLAQPVARGVRGRPTFDLFCPRPSQRLPPAPPPEPKTPAPAPIPRRSAPPAPGGIVSTRAATVAGNRLPAAALHRRRDPRHIRIRARTIQLRKCARARRPGGSEHIQRRRRRRSRTSALSSPNRRSKVSAPPRSPRFSA